MMMDKRLIQEIPKAKVFIIKQVITQWFSLVCNIVLIAIVAWQLSAVVQGKLSHSSLLYGFICMLGLLIVRMICTRIQAHYSYLAAQDVKLHIRKKLYEKLLRLGNSYTKVISTSEIVQLSVEGVDQLETYFGRYLPQFLYSILAPLTLFLCFVWVDYKSAIVLFLCVPLIPISIIAIQKFAKKLLSKYWTGYANLGNRFLENLQGLTTLKIYQSDAYKHDEMNQEAQAFRSITMKVLIMQLNSVSVMDIIAYGGSALGSIIAAMNYLHGSISLGTAICIVLLSVEFFLPLRLLGSYFHIAMNGIAASDKIFCLLDAEEYIQGTISLASPIDVIEAKNLSFRYDEHRMVLKNIDFKIHKGQYIAIAGESGSGKSTLAKVMMGMLKDYQGNITCNAFERRNISDDSFYQQVSYVSHHPFIIKGSVRDNLKMANAQANQAQMIQVLKDVNLYDFLQQEQGLDTILQEEGSNLSGGQKQRLVLARALLKDSSIYIFDEATSNIDVESEQIILTIIEKLAKVKTIVMITHRLATLKKCNQIFLLQDGSLKEQGSHEELMKAQGIYADLYNKQCELEAYGDENYE